MILICPLRLPQKNGIKLVDLNEIYKTADYITVHIPKTDETTHMIGEAQIALMKKTVRLINCARGGIIDEAGFDQSFAGKTYCRCRFRCL